MSEKTGIVNNILLTFFIGFVADIAPFLFMELLPSLLNKGVSSPGPNYLAIAVTGILIGLITSIIFAKHFKEKEPQDIFFYALGIPAILIATVINLNTDFSARKAVDEARASASVEVMGNDVQPVIKDFTPVEIPVNQDNAKQSGFLDLLKFSKTVYAEEKTPPAKEQPSSNFIVSVGEYTDKDAAIAAYKTLLSKKLNTEKYISKNPQLLQTGDNTYVLIFSRHATQEEAVKAYKLLRINDPEYNPQVLKGR